MAFFCSRSRCRSAFRSSFTDWEALFPLWILFGFLVSFVLSLLFSLFFPFFLFFFLLRFSCRASFLASSFSLLPSSLAANSPPEEGGVRFCLDLAFIFSLFAFFSSRFFFWFGLSLSSPM